MDDHSKQHRPMQSFKVVNNLVKNMKESNDKNFRIQPTSKYQNQQTNSYRRYKSNGNEQSGVKPLLDCIDAEPLLTSKPYEKSMSARRRRNQPFNDNHFERSNDDDVNRPEISPGKNEIGRSTLDIRQPTEEQLFALKQAFNKILSERCLSERSLEQRQIVFLKLRELIHNYRADAQVILYGSIYFKCCLEKPGIMDIDVQFPGTSSYETLKQLNDIIKPSDICKEVMIDTDYKPSCINLITNVPNMRVRITSAFHRGIHLSELIRIYTKFDGRLLKLLRLFRILAKICNIDQPDIGTLHPMAFHLMMIHFLQQVEPAVLPCLHEHAYGIDNVPLTLTDDQYPEFLQLCKTYSTEWKSSNNSSIELLFLQFLSYYVKTFNVKQFVVSIQTRMPVLKIDKNWHSRKLLIEDPTDIKRSLCQTMSSIRSIDYFREILNTTLNYFGRKQKQTKKTLSNIVSVENTDEDLIEIVNDEEIDEPTLESKNLLHMSYKLFFKSLPPTVARDANIRQARVREYYRNLFEPKDKHIFKGLLRLNSTNQQFNASEQIDEINEGQNEEFFDVEQQSDNEDNQHEELSSNDDENEEEILENENQQTTTTTTIKPPTDTNNIPSLSSSPIEVPSLLENDKKDNPSEFFYDFSPVNFHAEQGAPFICAICNGVGHIKNECPELILPNMVELPNLNDNWLTTLSTLCQQITERSKPKERDISDRNSIVKQLEEQILKVYPDSELRVFGSFYNGFGFQHSDLDICLIFKDGREHNSDEVIVIMQKILRIMRSSRKFNDVQPVLNAKVPIIRSVHREFQIEIDISLHNMLAIENTRLLKTYTEIDPRVAELGYMVKHLAKLCGIGDASRGTLSSYAYIIMLIHFLQQTQPAVLPVLQQLTDEPTKGSMYKKCSKWNVYFYEDLPKIKQIWKCENNLSTGRLWVEFLRFYTEIFNYDEHVVTIRQYEPLLKHEKGWFKHTIAIEDPFELSHNLAGGLSPRNWTLIRRVFIRARQQFGIQLDESSLLTSDLKNIEELLFNVDELCPTNAPKRCEWCKGPYHIRKRCPKLATLANEKEKRRRMNKPNESSHWNNEPQTYTNMSYANNENTNGRNHPRSAPANYQTRPFYYPRNGRQSTYSNNSYRPNQQNMSRYAGCFICGQPDHLRAQCPQRLQQTNFPQ